MLLRLCQLVLQLVQARIEGLQRLQLVVERKADGTHRLAGVVLIGMRVTTKDSPLTSRMSSSNGRPVRTTSRISEVGMISSISLPIAWRASAMPKRAA